MKRISKVLKQGLIITCMVVLSVGLIELILMALRINPDSPFDIIRLNVSGELLGQYDEQLFWRLRDVRPEFTPGAKTIMCLTDSVSVMYQGAGYPNLLAEYLTEAFPGAGIEVFNGGVPGYTTFQGLKYFTQELLAYRPDLVVLCFGWNDHWQSNNGLPDKLQKSGGLSFLARLDFLRSVRLIYSMILKKGQTQYRKTEGKTLRVGLDDYRLNLQSFADICRQNNIRLLMMTAPFYVLPEGLLQLHESYNDIVRDIARKGNLPLLDPIKEFSGKRELFLEPEEDPVHYNWEGSKIIARALAVEIPGLLGIRPVGAGLPPTEIAREKNMSNGMPAALSQ
ncbi:MAG: GDSL-type esterase/lipase family protein [Pseudomonadota bacterium]